MWLIVGCTLAILLGGMMNPSVKVNFTNGGLLQAELCSLFRTIQGGTCTIHLKSRSGKWGRIELLQGAFNAPVMVIPSNNENTFYCVYDYDVDFQLIKFDLSKPFKLATDRIVLDAIVKRSTCEVARVRKADAGDWLTACKYLDALSSSEYKARVFGVRIGFFSIHTAQRLLIKSMHNRGDQGDYPVSTP